jgi:hypothetical protein
MMMTPAKQLEDIIDQLGELYARAEEILDQLIEEARDRKLAQAKKEAP